MNRIWTFVILVSLCVISFFDPTLILPTILNGAKNATSLSFELFSIYAVWLGIISIVENTKLGVYLSRGLSPLINFLYGKNISKEAKKYLSLSFSMGLLGVGGASVPLGIKAIEQLDDKSGVVNFPIIITIIIFSAGLQFLPTTIMSLLTVSGSTNPSIIVIPTFLSGLVTTISGLVLAFFLEKLFKLKKRRKAQ